MRRFLLALVDSSAAVRQLAEYLLRDVLAVKAPLLAYNHFVEAIFVLNGCTAGLHGARLGANMGGAGGGPSAATSLGQAEDGGQEGGAKDALSVAAPAQFTLKGRQHRYTAPSYGCGQLHVLHVLRFTCLQPDMPCRPCPCLTALSTDAVAAFVF